MRNEQKKCLKKRCEIQEREARPQAQLAEEPLPMRLLVVIVIIIVIVTAIVTLIKLNCCIQVANDSMYATPLRSKAFYKETGGNITKLEVFLQVGRSSSIIYDKKDICNLGWSGHKEEKEENSTRGFNSFSSEQNISKF